MFSLTDIYNIAIQIERNGEKDYRNAADTAENPKMKKLYVKLAQQEAEHAEWFAKMAEKASSQNQKFEDKALQELSQNILQKMVKDSSFLREDHDFTAIDTLDSAIDAAIEIERDTIIFYQFLYDLVEDQETQKKLASIIAEENNHVEILGNLSH